jgi:hypothetical protein
MNTLTCSVVVLALAVAGCDALKKDEAASVATTTVAVSAATPTPAAAPAAAPGAAAAELTDDAIPASEDFEDETYAKISEQSYKTDLEALKKEIEEP